MKPDTLLLLRMVANQEVYLSRIIEILWVIDCKLDGLPAPEAQKVANKLVSVVHGESEKFLLKEINTYLSSFGGLSAVADDNLPELSGYTPEELIKLIGRAKPRKEDELD